ncbi:hypothetical protein [Streptomyces sp. SID3343]|uniref:LppU/SCO3897 family protein n=1 Tax=Streptomyces sp. SID3343 TaxID=2690260 RepID=UPI00136C0D8C|nr:hypothetical protein [Streptomyces sp. SID3343]MYW05775.1 hypothetical protein [Streptomyces sp. SID3343]
MPRTPAVDRGTLALGHHLGQGGQGTVYAVTNKRINEAEGGGWGVVYKEYGADVLPELDAAALASRVDLLGTLSAAEGRWLCDKTAWPATVVEHQGRACGFLMREVPDRFRFAYRSLSATAGTERLANLEYLLNDDAYVAGIGLTISDRDRLDLLTDLATTLTRLHRIGVTVGDLSPKNLLFTTDPRPECFLIDCDAMRLAGATVLPQVETPDWQIPAGEEKATRATDVYKFGLLAIRLFARDQAVGDPAVLSVLSPALGDLARLSLDPDPARRPTPSVWAEHLAAAGARASTTPAAVGPPTGGRPPAPPTPRPGAGRPPSPVPVPPGAGPGSGNAGPAKVGAGVAALIVAVILALVYAHSRDSSHTASSDAVPESTVSAGQYSPGGGSYSSGSSGGYSSGSSSSGSSSGSHPSADAGDEPARVPASAPAPPAAPDPPRSTPTPDAVGDARVGSCFVDRGTGGHPDLLSIDCTSGVFKVVSISRGTTDLDSCRDVTDYDKSVSSSRNNLVLCLTYLNPGGTAYHAQKGNCVYGANGGGSWRTMACQTGNFKVLAVYRGSTDYAKCDGWPNYNLAKAFPVSADSGLDVLLCLSMNYPDDIGNAAVRSCLRKSGSESQPIFTNVGTCAASNIVVSGRTSDSRDTGFCGRDGATHWSNSEYPKLGYTVCWRWL